MSDNLSPRESTYSLPTSVIFQIPLKLSCIYPRPPEGWHMHVQPDAGVQKKNHCARLFRFSITKQHHSGRFCPNIRFPVYAAIHYILFYTPYFSEKCAGI